MLQRSLQWCFLEVEGLFNLAFGAQAYVSAAIFYKLHVADGWNAVPAVLIAVCLFPPVFTRRTMPRSAAGFAVAAPGILLVAGPAFTLVARQYHERVVEFAGGVFLRGNIVAPFIWSLLITCAFGVIVVATVGGIGLLRDRQWRVLAQSRLALPTVVATGYFVRVITLLTVAPEKMFE